MCAAGLLSLALLWLLVGLGTAAPAAASTQEPSVLMDDYAFIYSSPAQVEENLEQVADLGVDTVKVSMVWSLVAPDADSRTAPDFNAEDPGAYPADAWSRYDTLVRDASALGLGVYFQLTAPAPLWATTPGASGKEYSWSHGVDADDFSAFVRAVAERYSGNYSVDGQELPAVHMWGIWNEPNEVGWLSPQTERSGGQTVLEAPVLERGLIDGAYRSLLATGHGQDTILIGETASGGNTHTLPFLQALYCLNARYRPLSGALARLEGCPTGVGGPGFVAAHPGLFAISGWAHHPYSFDQAPDHPIPGAPDTITFANLGVLERALDRVDAAYDEPGGLPIYVTEWGYKSNPPNPFVGTSLGQQETWLDEGWYLSYRMPRVRTMAQELLYDQPPVAGKLATSAAAWKNFDSGLEFQDGSPKPSYDAFRLPLWIARPSTGGAVPLWAEIRPARITGNPTAVLEYQGPHGGAWTQLCQLTTHSPEGFIDTRVAIPHPGRVRLAWYDANSASVDVSRTVIITAARR